MGFTRSSSGIGNQYLFHNVDAVIYTEGGEISWSLDDVLNDQYNNISIDIVFWRRIFKTYSPDKKFKFKALGSKAVVSKIAQKIIDDDLRCSIATMDSEFDEIYKLKLQHPNIIYTYGYSWENDVWNSDLFKVILEDLSGEPLDEEEIKNCISEFSKKIEDCVFADAYLFGKGQSFLPRKGHLKCVDCSLTKSPTVIDEFINQLFSNSNITQEKVREFGRDHNLNSERFCYGHLLNDFYYHVCRYFSIVVLKIKAINKELLEKLAISKIATFGKTEIINYYSKKIIEIMPSAD